MKKISGIHNKTKDVDTSDMPFNPKNILLNESDLTTLFNNNGLKDIKYNNINLYRNALVHKSYCTMKNADFNTGNIKCPPDCLPLQEMSYERLEFLGDSILGMVTASYLYERFPDQNEGFLSKIRTKIVNGKMLGFLSDKIGFPKFAIISKQVEEANGRTNYKIMEDIFEAFIGAIYIDFQIQNDNNIILPSDIKLVPLSGPGYYIVEQWIVYIIENYIDFSELIRKKNNYKDMLVSHMQHHLQDLPRYFEVNVITKDNAKIFTYCVKDRNNSVLATSNGSSKKEAENNVSKEALSHYGIKVD